MQKMEKNKDLVDQNSQIKKIVQTSYNVRSKEDYEDMKGFFQQYKLFQHLEDYFYRLLTDYSEMQTYSEGDVSLFFCVSFSNSF